MYKLILRSQEKNINYLNQVKWKVGTYYRPTIESTDDIMNSVVTNSYVPKTYARIVLVGITEAIENYLLNGHRIQL